MNVYEALAHGTAIGLIVIGLLTVLTAKAEEVCPPNMVTGEYVENFVTSNGGRMIKKIEDKAEFAKVFSTMKEVLGPFNGRYEPNRLWVIDVPPLDGTVFAAYGVGQCFYQAFNIEEEKINGIIDKALNGNRT